MTPATSSSASSPNGETDMNDIDIGEGRRLLAEWRASYCQSEDWIMWAEDNAAVMFDAIETGRQWETIARRLADYTRHRMLCAVLGGYNYPCDCGLDDALAAFRDLADRTPTPTDGAS